MAERRLIERGLNIPQHPQTQESLAVQLRTLNIAANKLGLYDAADWLWELRTRGLKEPRS